MRKSLKDSVTIYVGSTFSLFIGVIGFLIAIFIMLSIGGYIGHVIGTLFGCVPIVSRQRLITFKELKNRMKRAKRQRNKDLFDTLNFAEKHMQASRKVYDIEFSRTQMLSSHELGFLETTKIHARRRLHPRDIVTDIK